MGNKEDIEKNIEINDENVDKNVVSEENTENASAKADNSADEMTAEPTIEEQLEAAKKEVEQYKDKYLRAVAEFDNYRKRTLKEKAELLLNGSEKAVCAFLPILDDFERAIADKTEDVNAIKEGMQIIFNKFNKTLESLGVKKIETEGKDFDVDFHEAVAMVPGMGDDKKGKVIDCVQTGYQLNDKVIRHAKVAVGQ
ncbi:MAG: nucleotide exchange factor GrpE [Prevotella stercorea]|jgi:molecular chaperone GrpE|uniref:nucleotide exchange factor GrpE n=1 Tax=Leyella stercorea TaxID=363265 RepID=UPI000340D304|nr:nucleotide exchange factor GrpE [Leyella stercorea]MCI5988793.1 nucleotide exchange factor GrpE [Prevotella sp.]CDB05082.1 protein GrpE [Prevotella sp. CAG:520]MCF2615192.1 nucleotide exchange factor GrpE [Leyella stercorea]MCI6107020.1 nucleotide exchange factor GrpE [Prevotella sp.]MCI6342700.1 nucleotide exchange factor GrpE [Prevotella sp.]